MNVNRLVSSFPMKAILDPAVAATYHELPEVHDALPLRVEAAQSLAFLSVLQLELCTLLSHAISHRSLSHRLQLQLKHTPETHTAWHRTLVMQKSPYFISQIPTHL